MVFEIWLLHARIFQNQKAIGIGQNPRVTILTDYAVIISASQLIRRQNAVFQVNAGSINSLNRQSAQVQKAEMDPG